MDSISYYVCYCSTESISLNQPVHFLINSLVNLISNLLIKLFTTLLLYLNLLIYYLRASHKSNSSFVPHGYVEIRTLGHVGGGDRCGGYNLERVTMMHAG
jgi:hypothetical protein